MWPFKKKQRLPPPEDVVVNGMRAQYSSELEEWDFTFGSIDFTLSGPTFDVRAFEWARIAAEEIKQLEVEIDQKVLQVLEGWPCDRTTRRLLSVSLDDYAESKSIDLAYVGDDSWGDFGVNIVIRDGEIVDAYGGD